ncbi:MAG: ATP-binding protein [Oscillatoriales cyanobacterium SM2_1_8]|nr:ATP-binding protein [Oscillatoriales cyanobacterium SM2_1_8]
MDAKLFPGTLESLAGIADYVLAAAAHSGLDKRATYRLRLAVDEVATNIVAHGYVEAGLSGHIQVVATTHSDRLQVILEDTAIPYNPLTQATPDNLDTPIAERPLGGLGVFLTIQGCDRFAYEYHDGHNRNIFEMNLPTPTEPTP